MIYNESKYNTHWETKKLSQLGTFDRGKSRHRPRDDKRLFEDGKYPLIQTGEVKAANLYVTSHNAKYSEFGLAQSKLWPAGTLCITIAANIAETAILGYPMCFPDSVIGFNAFPEESSELFMHYVFTYIRKAIQNSTGGSIQDNINKEYLESLDFKIPPKPYQDKIVHILSSIDKKIDLNNTIIQELELLSQAIYDLWFVEFEFPDDEGKPYKSSGGKMVWNNELGKEIPEGWGYSELNDSIKLWKGISYSSTDLQDDGTPMINLGSINRKKEYVYNALKFYTGEISTEKVAVPGDLLIACTDLTRQAEIIGFPIIVPFQYTSFTYSMDLVKLEIKSRELNKFYLYSVLRREVYHNYIKRFASGTNVLHLNTDGIYQYKILKPSIGIQEKFQKHIERKYNLECMCLKENEDYRYLHDFLLPLLMNGQVTFN